MTTKTIEQSIEWQSRPLCCRYLVVRFEALSIQVPKEGIARDLTTCWALGTLADGQREVLGVWLESLPGVIDSQKVFDDLKARGVERIRFVATTEPAVARVTHRGATVLPSVEQLVRQRLAQVAPRERRSAANALIALRTARTAQAARTALANLSASPWGAKCPAAVEGWHASLAQLMPLFALAPRLRRILLSADEAAERMHGNLIRAIDRRGCFASLEAAVSFLVEALRCSERRLSVPQADLKARAEHRASGAGIRSSIEAVGL